MRILKQQQPPHLCHQIRHHHHYQRFDQNMSDSHSGLMEDEEDAINNSTFHSQDQWREIHANFTLPFSSSQEDQDQFETIGKTTMRSIVEDNLHFFNGTELNRTFINLTTFTGDPSLLLPSKYAANSVHSISFEELSPTMLAFQRLIYSIIIPLMLFFCVISSIINLIIVLSARWCRKPMSPTLYFSISLALADAFASIILGTGIVVNSLLPKVFNIDFQNLCFPLALEAFRLGGILVAVTHLLALAINHWMGIAKPLHYESTMTRGTALRIIVLAWICPICLLLLYFSKSDNEGFRSELCQDHDFLQQRTFRVIFSSLFFAPFIAMTLIYWHIFIIVRNHLHYRLKYQSCQQLRRNVKAVVTTVLILGTYIVGWMPAIIWFLIVCDDCIVPLHHVPRRIIIPVNVVINILLILKAFIDPIIYAARMSDIQIALKKMRYDCLLWMFGGCVPPPRTLDPAVLGSVRFTKSFRMSSRGSSSHSNV